MGISEFTEIRDYCILCAVLMYLEDKEEQEQFLLSELIDYVETQLKSVMAIDWTSFSQRKSLVRVLQYMERLQMLRVYEGKSEAFSQEAGQEVLYENTGYSKYFATTFPTDISEYKSWQDFEKSDFEELSENRGAVRIHRVYRQLSVCPSFFWEGNEDADALYLKNQRQWVGKYLQENLGGNLEIYKNTAFLTLDADDCYGLVHPRDAMLSEAVLLVCAKIREKEECGEFTKTDRECIELSAVEFEKLMEECRKQNIEAWSKEFREMDKEKLTETVLEYMKNWMMIKKAGDRLTLMPSAARLAGFYPEDFNRGEEQE